MAFVVGDPGWVGCSYDALSPGRHTLIGASAILVERVTAYQHLVIADVPALGRGLFLDGNVQLLAEGELSYHERLALLPVLAHPQPRRVLILGGGDGCAAREVLRDPRVAMITLVELDADVIATCALHLAELNRGSLHDPRVTVIAQDARLALASLPVSAFDVVIVDFLDAYTSADLTLYAEVLAALAAATSPEALVSLHGDLANPPYWSALRLRALAARHFAEVLLHSAYVPCYQSEWGFLLAGAGPALAPGFSAETLRTAEARLRQPLQTVVPELFPAGFRLAPQLAERAAQLAADPFTLPATHLPETRWPRCGAPTKLARWV